jgi:hypothetical protein
MVDYVVTQDFGSANSIVARMNILMGFPNARVKTDRYAVPIEHATNAGEYLVPIKEVGAPAFDVGNPGDPDFVPGVATVEDINGNLNPGERNTIKSREVLESEGAFPEPEIL